MNNSILVKLSNVRGCIDIATVSRQRGRNGRFTFTQMEINKFIANGRLIAHSWNGFADMYQTSDKNGVSLAQITFYRLSEDVSGHVTGCTETIRIPVDALLSCTTDGSTWKGLSVTKEKPVKLIFHGDHLRSVAGNPVIRKKFSKFISRNFDWKRSSQIDFYNDFNPYDFYFEETTPNGNGIRGGVILHNSDDPVKAKYAIHT